MYLRNKIISLLVALLICLSNLSLAMAEPELTQTTKEETPKVTNKIFILVIDGLQAETLQKTSAPNINGIATTGVRSTQVNSVFPDTAQSTVASILTGLLPEKHNFIEVGDKLKGKTIQGVMEGKKINTAFFGAEGEIEKLMVEGGHNCSGPFNNKNEIVMNNVLNEWAQSQSYLNIVVLPELRSVLNKHGVNSNEYKMEVTKVDNQVGRLLKKLHDEGSYDTSMIVLTGTLGAPPLIMKGLPFKQGTQIPPVSICDIAPTLSYLNGINLGKVDGLVLWNSLKNIAGQSEDYMLKERIKDLSIANAHLLTEMSRLQEEKLQVKRQQEIVAKEKEDIQREIEVRDKKISSLENRISVYHGIAILMVGVFGFGYVVLYRLLRKRFLMF